MKKVLPVLAPRDFNNPLLDTHQVIPGRDIIVGLISITYLLVSAKVNENFGPKMCLKWCVCVCVRDKNPWGRVRRGGGFALQVQSIF